MRTTLSSFTLDLFTTKFFKNEPMASRRRTIRFWKKVFRLFILNVIISFAVYFAMDYSSAIEHLKKDSMELVLIIAGLSFGAAFVITSWYRTDAQLRQW